MTTDIFLVLAIAVGAMGLFITEKLRIDVVAILVLVSLTVLDLIKPAEALSGFSNSATITVGAMFVLAAGLQNSGALSGINALLERTRSPFFLLLTLFILLAIIAPFVNNTAVVAVFMPIVINASLQIGMAPSKALIPLSYVSQMTGVCTLIGTSTNLIVNSVAQDLGHRGFTMFEFAPLGLVCLGVGCVYLLTIGRWLLPDSRSTSFRRYEYGHYVTEMRVPAASELIGKSASEAGFADDYGVYVLSLTRKGIRQSAPRAEPVKAGDVLLARGHWPNLEKVIDAFALTITTNTKNDESPESTAKRIMTEVMIAPSSRAAGYRLAVLDRTWQYNASILGVQRRGQIIRSKLQSVRLKVGDILLLVLPESDMQRLRNDRTVIVLSERSAPHTRGWRAPFALLTMAAVIATAALGWVPIAVSALAGAALMTLAGCLQRNEVYDSMDWSVLILMAGLLPLGAAMSATGAAQYVVDHTLGLVQDLGPHAVLAVLYLMALFFGELMSNSAAAVLLTPIGISTAKLLDTEATPFLIAITFSASTSFLTPVGYQTNMMVYSAGGYKFTDFVKVGLPLNLIFWVLGVLLIPIFWPFSV